MHCLDTQLHTYMCVRSVNYNLLSIRSSHLHLLHDCGIDMNEEDLSETTSTIRQRIQIASIITLIFYLNYVLNKF